MQYFDYFIVPLIALIGVVIIFSVITKDRKEANIVFSALVLAIVCWIVFAFFSDLFKNIETSLVFNRLVFFSLSFLGPLLFHFSLAFPKPKKHNNITLWLAYGVGALFAALSIGTSLVVSGVVIMQFGSDLVTGPGYFLVLSYLFVFSIASSYFLLTKYLEAVGQEKKRLQIFFLGITSVLAINLVVYYVVRPIVGSDRYYRIGNYSSILFILATAYSIVANSLFDIRAILTTVFAITLNVILFTQIFLSKSLGEFIVKAIVSFVVAIGSYSLVKSVSREIARRKEIEKLAQEKIETLKELEQRNKSLAALQRVSDIVLNESDMKQMSQKILDTIPHQLDNCIGAFLSIVRGGHLVAYSFSTNDFTRKVYSLVGEDLEKYSFPIKHDFNALHTVLVDKKIVEGADLAHFISPPISKPVSKTLQTLLGAKYIVALPLYAAGEPLGVMMFVYKVPKERLHNKDVEIAQAIAGDMSLAIQRAQAFQKLKDANEYLSQLDKMKDEFISMASHELNTPLAAIEGYLSMILDEGMGKVDAKSKEYLSRAYASSKRLAELILDLLNVSRIEQGRLKMKFSKSSLIEMAQSVVHELQIRADTKKIYLKVEAAPKVPELWCDPDRIREVIVNLAGNAIKFTDKGGVTIKISPSEGDFVRVAVSDTGRGIAKEDQKKLFQKFSQVKREVDEHQGTGLGLYISKNFVELHKGKLWVESEAGKGATFIFELPVLKEAPKEVDGAILEKPIDSPQIEVGTKDVPAIITESSAAQK